MPFPSHLLQHPGLWRARERGESGPAGLPSGFDALDRCLPGGGWPRHGLVEVLTDRYGIGEVSLWTPVLARLCGGTGEARDPGTASGWLAWVAPPFEPYAPALAAGGIDVGRVLVVRGTAAEWAMEQALRSGACSAVLGWATPREPPVLRRLQLAAEQASCLAVLFRPLAEAGRSSPAVLRLALRGTDAGLEVRIVKSRGGRPGCVLLGPIAASATSAVVRS